jgi:cell division protein FtsQ
MLNSKMVRNLAILFSLGIFIVVGCKFSQKWLKQVGFIPIEVVTLTDKLHYVDPLVVKSAVMGHMQEGFFGLKVNKIQQELKNIPWVANANVQRCWPNAVKIKIFEKQPLAIWEGRGIIDTEGKLFFPVTVANVDGLPEFSGNEEYVDSMVDMYLLVLSALKPIGLAVQKLDFMPEQGWRVMLNNGITIVLGLNELQERLARFVLAYEKIVNAGPNCPNIVDLRYTNGLAIG